MITEIRYNWHQVTYDEESGEDWQYAVVGKKEKITGKLVSRIDKKWETIEVLTYKITFEDNSSVTIFNPNMVFRSPE